MTLFESSFSLPVGGCLHISNRFVSGVRAIHLVLPQEPGGDSFQTDWLTPLAFYDDVGAMLSSEQKCSSNVLLRLATFAMNKL